MLVRIVKSWNYPSDIFRQIPGYSTEWDGVMFTEEPVEECDVLIVLQNPNERIQVTCKTGGRWLISQEPPVKSYRFCKKAYRHFDRVYTYYNHKRHPFVETLQPMLPWHVDKSYDELVQIEQTDLEEKKDQLTWITSNKNLFQGHKKRMEFKNFLLGSDLNFKLLGKGFTPIQDKFDGLFPVKYALAIENYQQKDYWTEKLADCFLSWCLPFYWGAENIADYFPADSFIKIDITDFGSALATIEKAMRNSEWEKRLRAIEEARNLVLNHYQFFPYVSEMIKKEKFSGCEKKEIIIPANNQPKYYNIAEQTKYYINRLCGELIRLCPYKL